MTVRTRFPDADKLAAAVGISIERGCLRLPGLITKGKTFEIALLTHNGQLVVCGTCEALAHEGATTWIRFLSATEDLGDTGARFDLTDAHVVVPPELGVPRSETVSGEIITEVKPRPARARSGFAMASGTPIPQPLPRRDSQPVRVPAAVGTSPTAIAAVQAKVPAVKPIVPAIRSVTKPRLEVVPPAAKPVPAAKPAPTPAPVRAPTTPPRQANTVPRETSIADAVPKVMLADEPTIRPLVIEAGEPPPMPRDMPHEIVAIAEEDLPPVPTAKPPTIPPATSPWSGAYYLPAVPPGWTPDGEGARKKPVTTVPPILVQMLNEHGEPTGPVQAAMPVLPTGLPMVPAPQPVPVAIEDAPRGPAPRWLLIASMIVATAGAAVAISAVLWARTMTTKSAHATKPPAAARHAPPAPVAAAPPPAAAPAPVAAAATPADQAPAEPPPPEPPPPAEPEVDAITGSEPQPVNPEPEADVTAAKPGKVPATGPCKVEVTATAKNVGVWIEGIRRGVAPVTLRLPCRPTAITMRHPRYVELTKRVTPTKRGAELEARMQRPGARLKVVSTPGGAAIEINGRGAGKTPLVTTINAYESVKVEIAAPGMKTVRRSIYPKAGTNVVAAKLKPSGD